MLLFFDNFFFFFIKSLGSMESVITKELVATRFSSLQNDSSLQLLFSNHHAQWRFVLLSWPRTQFFFFFFHTISNIDIPRLNTLPSDDFPNCYSTTSTFLWHVHFFILSFPSPLDALDNNIRSTSHVTLLLISIVLATWFFFFYFKLLMLNGTTTPPGDITRK